MENKDLDRLLELYLNYINHVPHGEVPQEFHELKLKLEEQLQTWDDEQYRNIVWNANQYHDLKPKYEKLEQENTQLKEENRRYKVMWNQQKIIIKSYQDKN